jgi:signal transduction histidine kinase
MQKKENQNITLPEHIAELNVHPFSLWFKDKALESDFRSNYFTSSIFFFRIAFIVVALLYSLFGYIDYLGEEINISEFHLIRYSIVLPLFIITFALSFTKSFKKYWQKLLVFNFVVAGSGISYMIIRLPDNMFYYAGLFLVFMAGFFFIRMRFVGASVAGITVLLIYNFGIIFTNPERFDTGYVIISNAFYISSIIIGMAGLYNLELLQRRFFMQQHHLEFKQKEIESINNNLEKVVSERTQTIIKRNRELKKEILHRKSIEEKLVEAKEMAEESNQLKSSFIRSISHEVRTPMNAIIGFVNIILTKLDIQDESLLQFEKLIHRNSENLLQIIDNTLDISKIHSQSLYFNKKLVNLEEICAAKFKDFQDKNTRNLVFTFEADKSQNEKVFTDGERVGQLIDILLNNAFKFTNNGYVKMSLEHDESSASYFVSVIDTGIGIDEHLQDEIFQPFNKYDDFAQGIGLGLFIARSIADQLNIKLMLESNKGKGSKFTLQIPIMNEIETEQKKIKLAPDQKGKVLVIEDNEDNYLVVESFLAPKYELTWKTSGFDGLEYFTENDVDLVILDIMMTGMDGIETCERIRSRNPETPIVMLSAMISAEFQDKAKSAGANLFLFKPIDFNLQEQIDAFFE